MGSFQSARPLQDVRLRKWPGGRVAALKLMVSRLETALNDTLGAQVDQSPVRITSDQVPFILNFKVDGGYRLFKVSFPTPPGLVDLLFYEIFHDDNPAFTDPTILRTPMTNVMISGVGLGEVRFFKARVVNSSFEASTFTDTLEVVSASRKVAVVDVSGTGNIVNLLNKPAGVFIDVVDFNFAPSGGALTIMAHVALASAQGDGRDAGVAGAPRRDEGLSFAPGPGGSFIGFKVWHKNYGPAHAQFRWVIDGKVARFPRFLLSQRPFNGANGPGDPGAPNFAPWGVVAQGTMITPFFRTEKLSLSIKLQAALNLGSEWQGGNQESDAEGQGPPARREGIFQIEPLVLARNVKVIEVQEEF